MLCNSDALEGEASFNMVRSGSISKEGAEDGMVDIVGGKDGKSVGLVLGLRVYVGDTDGKSVGDILMEGYADGCTDTDGLSDGMAVGSWEILGA